MPLIGDAVIGLSALVVAYLIWKKRGLWVWTSVIVWNVVAIWDALSAFVIQTTNPWPEFFMLQLARACDVLRSLCDASHTALFDFSKVGLRLLLAKI